VDLVLQDFRPRRIITKAAIENAIEVALALGGSVNCIRHLTAIAAEAEIDMDVIATFEQRASGAVQIVGIRPNGTDQVWDLEANGGVQTVLRVLASRLNLEALSVSGNTVAELVAQAREPDGAVVHGLDNPVAPEPGLIILRGNLAPDGAIVKLAGVSSKTRRQFCGPACVYAIEDDAIAALGRGEILPGQVIVLRGMGVRGGPGTVFAASFVAALNGAGLSGEVAVVTDGELSGLNYGLIVGQVMPEAADGGPLAGVTDGDMISIDLDRRTLDVDPVREGDPVYSPSLGAEVGYLGQYAALVSTIQKGAVLRRPGSSQ
jgi:dihydroxy-acid dehydratase